MPALLEAVAEQNKQQVLGFARACEDESRAIVTNPSPYYRAQRATEAARYLSRFIPFHIESIAGWVNEVEGTLKHGLNKNTFTNLIKSGSDYLNACRDLIGTAETACREAEPFSESAEIKEARNIIATASIRLRELEAKVLCWKKIADRQPPEIDPALIERGADQIKQGHFKTGEQILEEISKHSK